MIHRHRNPFGALALLLLLGACGEAKTGQSRDEVLDRFGTLDTTNVIEPIEYTDQAYGFTGETPIADVVSLIGNSGPCSPNPCSGEQSFCTIDNGAFECVCPPGTTDSNGTCVDDAACEDTSCNDHGQCTFSLETGISCDCNNGYTGPNCGLCDNEGGYYMTRFGDCSQTNVWYGFDPDVNVPFESPSGQCDRFNSITELDALPQTIEGIITLHPRYFQKISFCGSDERYYAAFVMEDSSGGILVLKDSRIADFTYGDRVKLRVRGLLKFFDTRAVLIHDGEEVVSDKTNPIFYRDIGFRDLTVADIGNNLRIRGEIADPPTSANFSEMCLVPDGGDHAACSYECRNDDNCSGYMLVTLDREIVQRDPGLFEVGKSIGVTGPAVNSFGFRLLVARIGQLDFDVE